MKQAIFILMLAAGAVVSGCASSNAKPQPLQPVINESAGSNITISTNAVEPQARDANQQPYQHSWGLQDQY